MSIKIPSPEECYQKYKEHLNLRMGSETNIVIYHLENDGKVFTQNLEVAEAFLAAGYRVITFTKPTSYKITFKELGDI